MGDTITLTIPADWLEEESLDQEELREALTLGLIQLRQRRGGSNLVEQTVRVLTGTGRVRHLSSSLADEEDCVDRQAPPTLPDPPVSEILVAQRRGEL